MRPTSAHREGTYSGYLEKIDSVVCYYYSLLSLQGWIPQQIPLFLLCHTMLAPPYIVLNYTFPCDFKRLDFKDHILLIHTCPQNVHYVSPVSIFTGNPCQCAFSTLCCCMPLRCSQVLSACFESRLHIVPCRSFLSYLLLEIQ